MDLEDLRVALAVARAGSLSGASELLGITTPTLSKAIARLEREHKIRLFERLPRGMRPTEMGTAFLDHARGLDLLAGDLYAALRDLRQARSGILRVGFGQGVPDAPLVQLTSTLAERGVNLELSGGMTDSLTKSVALGELEFAVIGLNQAPTERLAWEPLRADPMVPVVTQEHPLARRRTVSWATLVSQRWIVPARGTAAHSEFQHNFRSRGLEAPTPWIATRNAGREVLMAAAMLAIVVAPSAMIEAPSLRERLRVLRPEGGWQSDRQLGLVYRTGGYLSPMAEWAMASIREALAPHAASAPRKPAPNLKPP